MVDLLAICVILGFTSALLIGMPAGIGIAVAGFGFRWMGVGDFLFEMVPSRTCGGATKLEFLAIPRVVCMGVMLEKLCVAEDMLEVVGGFRGG